MAKKFDTCPSVAICPVIADSTVGCACPSAVTARPHSRSRCLRPSASQTYGPSPRTNTRFGVPNVFITLLPVVLQHRGEQPAGGPDSSG